MKNRRRWKQDPREQITSLTIGTAEKRMSDRQQIAKHALLIHPLWWIFKRFLSAECRISIFLMQMRLPLLPLLADRRVADRASPCVLGDAKWNSWLDGTLSPLVALKFGCKLRCRHILIAEAIKKRGLKENAARLRTDTYQSRC